MLPATPTRFTHSERVAFRMSLPKVPAGSVERSNRINVRLPPPTERLADGPKFMEGYALVTYVSPLSGASAARSGAMMAAAM